MSSGDEAGSSTEPSRRRHSVLRGRALQHLEQIRDDIGYLDEAVSQIRPDGWVAAWTRSGTREQGQYLRILERSFEQIINDLHAMFDAIELAAYDEGLAPDPSKLAGQNTSAEARDAWWATAESLRFELEGADRGTTPGRWRRLALAGRLEHSQATDLTAGSDIRQLLQHRYARRTQADATRAWEAIIDARQHLPAVIGALDRLLDEIDPTP